MEGERNKSSETFLVYCSAHFGTQVNAKEKKTATPEQCSVATMRLTQTHMGLANEHKRGLSKRLKRKRQKAKQRV